MDNLTLALECGTIRVSIPSGTLSFSSNPPSADIYLIVGDIPTYTELQTPNTIDLYPGSYDYILKLTGFEDYTGTAVVHINDITIIDANLVPKATATVAPTLVAIGSFSMLGLLLATSARQVIPITTGILGGKVVVVKL